MGLVYSKVSLIYAFVSQFLVPFALFVGGGGAAYGGVFVAFVVGCVLALRYVLSWLREGFLLPSPPFVFPRVPKSAKSIHRHRCALLCAARVCGGAGISACAHNLCTVLCNLFLGTNWYRRDNGTGTWGGTCKCPDGQVYQVADNYDNCKSLACEGGSSGQCSQNIPSYAQHMRVTCGMLNPLKKEEPEGVYAMRACNGCGQLLLTAILQALGGPPVQCPHPCLPPCTPCAPVVSPCTREWLIRKSCYDSVFHTTQNVSPVAFDLPGTNESDASKVLF